MSETLYERIMNEKDTEKLITAYAGDLQEIITHIEGKTKTVSEVMTNNLARLRAELERVKAENEWHKYPDEKPEVDEVIDVIRQSAIRAAKFFDYFDAKGESSPRFATPVERVVMDDVMLWRSPLPAAPEEGE